jgi:hypothetical protein
MEKSGWPQLSLGCMCSLSRQVAAAHPGAEAGQIDHSLCRRLDIGLGIGGGVNTDVDLPGGRASTNKEQGKGDLKTLALRQLCGWPSMHVCAVVEGVVLERATSFEPHALNLKGRSTWILEGRFTSYVVRGPRRLASMTANFFCMRTPPMSADRSGGVKETYMSWRSTHKVEA